MRRITIVLLAVLAVASAAFYCVASDAAPAVNAASMAPGVAIDRESLKQAVAATQAVGLPNSAAVKQLPVRSAPVAQTTVGPAMKGAAQASSACPPAIDQATLKQVLRPALENAIKEIRAEMSDGIKPAAQPKATAPAPKAAPAAPSTPAPAVKAAPTPAAQTVPKPRPDANANVWPAIPACGKTDVPAATAPASAAPPQQAAKPTAAPAQKVESRCANCNRERVLPTPAPPMPQVQPSATKNAPAQHGANFPVQGRGIDQVANMVQPQGTHAPAANIQTAPAGQPAWGQVPAAAATGNVQPNVAR